ncbi:hypothetical protein CDL15_Pgr027012 [Punica granatum]|uniref:Uncharacterized protein n=1 Tax=Punica granatum TaxID=22663 RepID=A0A218Y2X8_PUNGR|nr:hypothetical protein CDL15_Pgr027012 [Punica granatum]
MHLVSDHHNNVQHFLGEPKDPCRPKEPSSSHRADSPFSRLPWLLLSGALCPCRPAGSGDPLDHPSRGCFLSDCSLPRLQAESCDSHGHFSDSFLVFRG